MPAEEVHAAYVAWGSERIDDPRRRALFARMAGRSGISRRWSVVAASAVEAGGIFHDAAPPTSTRMALYARNAPELALDAVDKLKRRATLGDITHLVVASCTGFVAPGIDQIVAARLGLATGVERLLIGFMGCYAAVAALRSAHNIVRGRPDARVLVICVELCTLHIQASRDVESLLMMLQFGDGAAAALVTAEPSGLRIERPFSAALPDSEALIQWHIGDTGFEMILSGEVPARLTATLADAHARAALLPVAADKVDDWAVHAGGRSILDAVAAGLGLAPDALDDSRAVLDGHGNMSSATLMFVLARKMERPPPTGVAIAFGPGIAAEGFCYGAI